jgi:protein-L-isoaspartate(D-aspartate) O-methyltransferase
MNKIVNPFVLNLVEQGILKTLRIIEAFKKIDRADFVPEDLRAEAYVDAPLPIGEGQTISQPLTVAFMLELLQPEPGNKIFEIGFGSGWQTAILAEIIGKSGKIYAVEKIKKLFEFGTKNISKYNFIEKGIVKTILGDATEGLKKYAPFDRIIAAASGREVPDVWLKELKIGGRLVVPIKESIWLFIKKSEKEFEKQEFPGFVFVPLVKG